MTPHSFISLLLVTLAHSSAISKSVFPNAACLINGFIGIGSVGTEQHCSCSSDNLPNFVACPPSSAGESVCNSILDLETGSFTAECAVISCSGSSCPTTVVNTVVVDEADCLYQGEGFIGFSTVNGETKCACSSSTSSDAEDEDFTICPSPVNGRGTCVSTDSDFLGQSLSHQETVKCSVICDKDHFLTPGGSCTKHAKRAIAAPAGPSGSFHSTSIPIKLGPSATSTALATSTVSSSPSKYNPSAHHHHHHHTSDATSIVLPSIPAKVGPSGTGTETGTSEALATATTSLRHRHGISKTHHRTNLILPTIPINLAPSPTSTALATDVTSSRHGASPVFSTALATFIVGPSQRARRNARSFEQANEEWVIESSQCSPEERACPVGAYGNYECIRLDDVTACGSCESSVNCLTSIVGIKEATCLRGECNVRSCAAGFTHTGQAACSPKA